MEQYCAVGADRPWQAQAAAVFRPSLTASASVFVQVASFSPENCKENVRHYLRFPASAELGDY
jgi:hypothetical protein